MRTTKQNRMVSVLLVFTMVMSLFSAMTVTANADTEPVTKIQMEVAGQTKTITEAQFNTLGTVTENYSALNRAGAASVEITGVKLTDLLALSGVDVSGLKDNQTITFTASDGKSSTFTIAELLKTARYAYTVSENAMVDDAGKQEVPVLISTEGQLVFGQATTDEYNKSNWISGLFNGENVSISISHVPWEGEDTDKYQSGTGTSEDPYIIATGAQLKYLAAQVNSGTTYENTYFKLSHNIDLNNKEFTPIGGGAKLEDGTATYKFKGTFDGNGKTINGLAINTTAGFTGLFGYNGGTIKDFTVNGTVTCTSTETTGDPTSDYIGGIVGFNAGTVSDVISNTDVTAPYSGNVGGIAGFNTSGNWRDSTSGADIDRNIPDATGLITRCGNTGLIKSYKKIGGITGENEGYITLCFNKGDLYTSFAGSGNGQGGITGRNGCNGTEWGIGYIYNCYNTGALNTKALEVDPPYFNSRYIGGISGFSSKSSRIMNCYTTGTVYKGYKDYYPLSARMDSAANNVSNSYSLEGILGYDTPSANKDSYYGIIRTEAEMKASLFLTELGGAYVADNAKNINDGYPILRWQSSAQTGVTVTKVEMTSAPSDVEYISGQTFDTTGMVLTATYSDGTTQQLMANEYTISKTGELETTDTKVTVSGSFGGAAFSFDINITVKQNELDSIAVTSIPNKVIYKSGETFDPAGMKVKATYTNGTSEVLTEGFTCTDTKLTEENKKVTVSYKYRDTTKTDSFDIYIAPEITIPDQDEAGNYLISSKEEFMAFADMVNQLGMTEANAKLTANIDISEESEYKPIGTLMSKNIVLESGRTYAFNAYYHYKGTFDGNGKSIKLNLNQASYGAVFGYLAGATVKDLTVTGSVTCTGSNAAGIAANIASGDNTISGCVNKATITGTTNNGGIVGSVTNLPSNTNTIKDCRNEGKVIAASTSGGIVGAANYAMIANCHNKADVTGTSSNMGGVAGTVRSITKSGNTGNITGTLNVGGVAGNINGTASAEELYNTGNVEGTYTVGGICGTSYLKEMTDSYNWGDVTATAGTETRGVGGIIGTQGNYALTIKNSYNAGTIAGSNGTIKVGSMVGYAPRALTISNSYYLENTAATSANANSESYEVIDNSASKTSEELKTLSETLGASFEATSTKYPVLTWQWSDWIVTKEVTLTEDGLKARYCDVADETETRFIDSYSYGQIEEQKKALEEQQKAFNEQLDLLRKELAKLKIDGKVTTKGTSASYNSVKITWTKISKGQGYEIYRATSKNGTYTKVKTVTNPSITSFTNTGRTCGTTYYYKVRAYATYTDSEGAVKYVYGSWSSSASVKPIPAKVATVKLTAGAKKVTAKWSAVSGASGYQVSLTTNKTSAKIVKNTSGRSYTKTKLTKNKRYYVKVRAYKKVGGKTVYGSWSTVKSIKAK